MTVFELIQLLRTFDPEMQVIIPDHRHPGDVAKVATLSFWAWPGGPPGHLGANEFCLLLQPEENKNLQPHD